MKVSSRVFLHDWPEMGLNIVFETELESNMGPHILGT